MKPNEYCLFIDLDGTVYDQNNGMWEEMSARIDVFLENEIGIPRHEVLATRENYYRSYGSTLRGLQLHQAVDAEAFLDYVHDLDLNTYLAPDPKLKALLASLPYPKWIFTNSHRHHAERVLQRIGIEDQFEGIIDVWALNYLPKPHPKTYAMARAIADNPRPSQIVFVDDTLKNLTEAKEQGWHTIWIDQHSPSPYAPYTIPTLFELPAILDQMASPSWLRETPQTISTLR